MAVLLPHRPMEQNHADNARMLAEETADLDRRSVPVPGAPASSSPPCAASRTPS
ncbi:hypothetical protein SGLAM104S_10112 [Streptomyces glaucescens]